MERSETVKRIAALAVALFILAAPSFAQSLNEREVEIDGGRATLHGTLMLPLSGAAREVVMKLAVEHDDPAALAIARDWLPDVILLDVMMPGMDGFEVCRRLKADQATEHVPVVMVTALGETSERVRGLEAGADDFLTKPVDDETLFARVRATPPARLGTDAFAFTDPRLQELLFRYRARNWPDTLDAAEHDRWNTYRRERLGSDRGWSELDFTAYFASLDTLRVEKAADARALGLLDALDDWGRQIEASLRG